MTGPESGSGSPDAEPPNEVHKALIDSLIEQNLQGIECTPVWEKVYKSNLFELVISRESQCVYRFGFPQKKDITESTPLAAAEFMEHITDATNLYIEFPAVKPTKLGAYTRIRASDDGVIFAHNGRKEGYDDILEDEARQAEKMGGQAMITEKVGRKLSELLPVFSYIFKKGGTTLEEDVQIVADLRSMSEAIAKSEVGDTLVPKLTGEAIASALIRISADNGELRFAAYSARYTTYGNHIEIFKDPFHTSTIGEAVLAQLVVTSPIGTPDNVQTLNFMDDKKALIHSGHPLSLGPYGDYSQFEPDDLSRRMAESTVIADATADDYEYFIRVMQEPERRLNS